MFHKFQQVIQKEVMAVDTLLINAVGTNDAIGQAIRHRSLTCRGHDGQDTIHVSLTQIMALRSWDTLVCLEWRPHYGTVVMCCV